MTQPRQPDQKPDTNERNEPSLYRRMGGYDVIAAAIDGYVEADARRSSIRPLRDGAQRGLPSTCPSVSRGSVMRAGGRPVSLYGARHANLPHKGLGITESDWQATMKYMRDSMTELKVPQREQDEVIALWTNYKGEIVE